MIERPEKSEKKITGYSLFIEENYKIMKNAIVSNERRISHTETMIEVGKKWNHLSEAKKRKWNDKAERKNKTSAKARNPLVTAAATQASTTPSSPDAATLRAPGSQTTPGAPTGNAQSTTPNPPFPNGNGEPTSAPASMNGSGGPAMLQPPPQMAAPNMGMGGPPGGYGGYGMMNVPVGGGGPPMGGNPYSQLMMNQYRGQWDPQGHMYQQPQWGRMNRQILDLQNTVAKLEAEVEELQTKLDSAKAAEDGWLQECLSLRAQLENIQQKRQN